MFSDQNYYLVSVVPVFCGFDRLLEGCDLIFARLTFPEKNRISIKSELF